MSDEGWRFLAASEAGTSHLARATPCQDGSDCRILHRADGSTMLVAVVSDGAGSASHAEAGARLACDFVHRQADAFFEGGAPVSDLTRDNVEEWLRQFGDEIAYRADVDGLTARDFACTLLVAMVEADRAAFLQIGDGAVVIPNDLEPDRFSVVFWPQRGEYANQTFFATDANAPDQLEFRVVERPIDEVALLSDGLQGLVLRYEDQTAHARFFGPVFAATREEPPGHSKRLSASLAAFLNSDRVNERTDDDKTLVVATRRPRPPVESGVPAHAGSG